MRARWLIGLLCAGCQARYVPAQSPSCPDMPLTGEATYLGPIVCAAQRFGGGGAGVNADTWMANSHARYVIRHPEASLTLAGLSGGTLVDAAPWGRADVIHEIAPLVGGGWLFIDDADIDGNTYTVTGIVRSLPDQISPSAGERATVSWRIEPDDPWLYLDGADGLWIHPAIHMDRIGEWLVSDRAVIGHDGVVEQDLGGAVRVTGASRLLLADPVDAWAQQDTPLQRVAGTAEHATTLQFFEDGALVASWPLPADGAFDGEVPTTFDGVQALGAGYLSSAVVAPTDSLDLALHGYGAIDIRLAWERAATQRPVEVAWSATDGRNGRALLPAGGGTIATGAGAISLTFSAGPGFEPRTLGVDVVQDATAATSVSMRAVIDPTRYIAANLAFDGSLARTQRATSPERGRAAIAAGYGWVVSTALDDVDSGATFLNDAPFLTWADGGTLTSERGWSITAWPWRPTPVRAAHGAPRIEAFSPLVAYELAWGGPVTDRTVLVDLAWLQDIDVAPYEVRTAPDWVTLPPSGPAPFEAWQTWFDWLDARRFVRPAGPVVWLDVLDRDNPDPVLLQRALTFGRSSAGTGARASVQIDEANPGDVLGPWLPEVHTDDSDVSDTDAPEVAPPRTVRLRLERGNRAIDQVSLIEDGEVVQTWPVDDVAWSWEGARARAGWSTLIGWSTTTDDWVVSTPIWDTPTASR